MYYVFLLRVIKLLACLLYSLTRLLHAEWHKMLAIHIHDFSERFLHPPLFWALFPATDETMPTSPNDSSSSSPPLLLKPICCSLFRAILAPSSGIFILSSLPVDGPQSLTALLQDVFEGVYVLIISAWSFRNTPPPPSCKHQLSLNHYLSEQLVGIDSSIAPPTLKWLALLLFHN